MTECTRLPRAGRATAATAAAAALGMAALLAPSARADILFYDTPGGIQPEENVLLVSGQVGPTIIGTTNQTGTVVTFTQPTLPENLTTPSAGQARIEGLDGAFTSLRTSLDPGGTFSLFEANPNFISGGLSFDVVVTEDNGQTTARRFTSGNGQSYFGVASVSGQRIRWVDIIGPQNALADVRQIRLGGVSSAVTAVPEPGAVAFGVVAGGGLLGLLARGRRRRQRGGSAGLAA